LILACVTFSGRKVLGVADAQNLGAAAGDVDLVDTARPLREAPIGGERLVEQLLN
jgi:hypothetical protein